MIRRTLQGGLLATVALFALVPTAAVAAESDHVVPAPLVATAPHRAHVLFPDSARNAPVSHRARHATRWCHHHARHHHFRHHCHVRRTHHIRHVHHATRTAYHHRSHALGRVGARHVSLNVRSGPGFGYRVIGHRHGHARLLVSCQRHGSYVHGNRHWYRLAHGRGYVSAHYVRVGSAVPWC
ncbi:SH3 domain-containing protein [Streptomyces sp. SID2888]|uniref:SH3 domain-containing protein n=1 Tax=Streptomyces sp. SID2888 TaxID=2690256 RepID=UPI00136EEAA1|nr:SH3 domain-containing protein [Streptomyces sp. SID2888]MYV48375.1 hypothetical protein [Streptomyces sp. SID2888]